jgi:hypothetical protein
MRDSETVVRYPHEATVTRRGGKKHVEVHDPRTSVTMKDLDCEVVLFFEGADFSGDAPLLEVSIRPTTGAKAFQPWRFMPRLPRYLQYARATIAHREGDAVAALRALREAGSTRRGLGDEFYRAVADEYRALVAEGEPHPVKALAASQPVDISTASRWITETRRRGYLKKETISNDR